MCPGSPKVSVAEVYASDKNAVRPPVCTVRFFENPGNINPFPNLATSSHRV